MSELEDMIPESTNPIGYSIATTQTMRVGHRHPYGVEVAFSRPENIIGETVDISPSGLFIAAGAPAPPNGSHMTLLVRFGDDRPWREVDVEVRWERKECDDDQPAGFGVRFVRLDPDAIADLKALLSEMATARHYGKRWCDD